MNHYLFSIDLEDVRLRMRNGQQYKERVPEMTERYLSFLKKHNAKATFFIVGDMAEAYPSLIRDIVAEGHETGCHSYRHDTLEMLGPEAFKKDVERNMEALMKAGAKNIYGFRAPVFSLTEKVSWAYEILEECGIKYSSSVLPAPSPLYGWPGFGSSPTIKGKILEIPMTLCSIAGKRIPFAGGIYFRLLPSFVIKRAFQTEFKKNDFILGYFHPYDIDTEQERFMHPGIHDSKIYNALMYCNRGSVFEKLEKVIDANTSIITYKEFINRKKLLGYQLN